MPTLTQAEQQDMRQRLETVRNQALHNLAELMKAERSHIWKQYYEALDMIGLDKDGKRKVQQ